MKKRVAVTASLLTFVGMALPCIATADEAEMLARGKALFASEAVPACAICHTLKDAGAEGAIGPDLDELKPSKEVVLKVLKEGMGAMPAFSETMSADDMQAVAAYIVSVTGSGQ